MRRRQPRSFLHTYPPKVACDLARFRYQLRRFLRFSEKAARAAGVTPQQHQLMLGVAGFTGRGWATISELAEFLQERHNAVVALVTRAAQLKLVRKSAVAGDRRFVRVELTSAGKKILATLSALHQKELARFTEGTPLAFEAQSGGHQQIPRCGGGTAAANRADKLRCKAAR